MFSLLVSVISGRKTRHKIGSETCTFQQLQSPKRCSCFVPPLWLVLHVEQEPKKHIQMQKSERNPLSGPLGTPAMNNNEEIFRSCHYALLGWGAKDIQNCLWLLSELHRLLHVCRFMLFKPELKQPRGRVERTWLGCGRSLACAVIATDR